MGFALELVQNVSLPAGSMNSTVVDLEVDTRLDERPHVGAVEGVEIAGADLDSPSTQVTPFISFCHSRRSNMV